MQNLIIALVADQCRCNLCDKNFPSYLLGLSADPVPGTWVELVAVAVTLLVAVTTHVARIGVTGDIEVTTVAWVDWPGCIGGRDCREDSSSQRVILSIPFILAPWRLSPDTRRNASVYCLKNQEFVIFRSWIERFRCIWNRRFYDKMRVKRIDKIRQ